MSEFKTPLEVRLLPESDDNFWQLTSSLVYESNRFGTIVVPESFITNFVSFSLLKNKGIRPSVVHDYLYSLPEFDRKKADRIFLEALLVTCESPLLARAMYRAVRLFGEEYKAKRS